MRVWTAVKNDQAVENNIVSAAIVNEVNGLLKYPSDEI